MVDKQLTDVEFDQLLAWLRDKDFKWNRLHRDCSDGVNVAHLIKKLWPRLIDMHNYPAQSSTIRKRSNWDVLNRKVLSKLGLRQRPATLDLLARSTPGIVEVLLFDIMKAKEGRGDNDPNGTTNGIRNSQIYTVNVQKMVGNSLVKVKQKMVPYTIYEAKVRESETKDTVLEEYGQKVAHLENMIRLKTDCIAELTTQREGLMQQVNEIQSNGASTSKAQKKTDKKTVEVADLIRFYDD